MVDAKTCTLTILRKERNSRSTFMPEYVNDSSRSRNERVSLCCQKAETAGLIGRRQGQAAQGQEEKKDQKRIH
jgi:hypothetical protein